MTEPINVAGLALEYGELTDEQRDAMIEQMVAHFVGLPGVVGAPMITGPDFWADVARHLIELGWRWNAQPIKTYEAPTSLERREAAGTWTYADPGLAPEDPQVRYARIHEAESEEYAAKVAEMRAAGELPPAGATAAQQQAWRAKRAANREKASFNSEVRRRRTDGTLTDSPLANMGKPKRRKGTR